jgi:signal transduction histidine kinase
MRRNSFSPHWLPAEWQLPWLGYLAAILLQSLAGLLTLVRHAWSPDFVLPGVVELLVVAVVALAWGAGPSLVATALGAGLLVWVVLPVSLGTVSTGVGFPTEVGLFVAVGVVIGLLASHTERARQQAVVERGVAYGEAGTARNHERRMEEFVNLTGHELQTPLTSLRLSLQVLGRRLYNLRIPPEVASDSELTTPQVRAIQQVLAMADEQIAVQSRLVGDLVDSARIQAKTFVIVRERCDLADIIRRNVREQRLVHPDRTISVSFPPPLDTDDVFHAPVCADEDRIGQVLRNYLSNALTYAPPELPIAVRVLQRPSDLRIEVADSGPGILASEKELIWERGRRGTRRVTAAAKEASAKSGSPGLGLGLYLSRTIIREHGGEVGVDSEAGEGSTFWFTLPLVSNSIPSQG